MKPKVKQKTPVFQALQVKTAFCTKNAKFYTKTLAVSIPCPFRNFFVNTENKKEPTIMVGSVYTNQFGSINI